MMAMSYNHCLVVETQKTKFRKSTISEQLLEHTLLFHCLNIDKHYKNT